MNLSIFITIFRGFLDTFLWYRFFAKMLGPKYRHGYLLFYLGNLLYGQMNVKYALAETGHGNLLYSCLCLFVLCSLLFHGSVIKKSFFIIWLYCVLPVAFNVFFPLLYAAFLINGQSTSFAAPAAGMLAAFVQYLILEILQRKLSILRHDFTDKDALYLMYIILFIYAAEDMMFKMLIGINDWKTEDIFKTAVPLSLIALSGLGLYVYCVLSLEHRLLERLAKQQYQMIEKQLKDSKEQYEQLVKLRHDMKNHRLCLEKLIKDNHTEEAALYLEQLAPDPENNIIQTGSVYTDAILNPKYQQAVKLGIDISIQMTVPEGKRLAPADICCLLSNALDNAIEACERIRKENGSSGWIRMKSAVLGEYWVFEISNSTLHPASLHNGKLFSSKRVHAYGVGFQNIRTVVERYQGVFNLVNEDCFTLSVMLPVPSITETGPSAAKTGPSAASE